MDRRALFFLTGRRAGQCRAGFSFICFDVNGPCRIENWTGILNPARNMMMLLITSA